MGRYGWPFLKHSYFHHFTRIDHRHNFSLYNTLLYIGSAKSSGSALRWESVAFVPQLLLSTIVIPIVLARKDLPSTMLAQTFAFVTFNKVCTSQVILVSNDKRSILTMAIVLLMVHGIPAILPPIVIALGKS